MLKIRAVKIEVNTKTGLFVAEYSFTDGLNIIRGNNSSGKSTLFQSILYGLGFEELLGGKNEKTMQAVLREQVEFPDGVFHPVLQSCVYLEIENKEIITIKRNIVSTGKRPQLLEVFSGPMLTGKDKILTSRPMFIHDKGGASDNTYGFHAFLAEFLGWELPEVVTTKGDISHLYLQQIAPAFIIEQKSGWSDLFATLPCYPIRSAESRVVEFLLGLDVFENERRRQKISSDKQKIRSAWEGIFAQLVKMADKCDGVVKGVDGEPGIINDLGTICIAVPHNGKEISLSEQNKALKIELHELKGRRVNTVGSNVTKNEAVLSELTNKLNQISLNYELLSPELNCDEEKLRQYTVQLDVIQEDLRKNKGAMKVKSLGAELPSDTAQDNCPTCHQPIKDSLLPSEIKQTPMRIEDNVTFLEAQKKMVEVYIEGQKRLLSEKTRKLQAYLEELSKTRRDIRAVKFELLQHESLPSALEIERRLTMQKKIESCDEVLGEFALLLKQLKELSIGWTDVISQEKELPVDFLTPRDRRTLEALQKSFVALITKFGYDSRPVDAIKISDDTYLPVEERVLLNGMKLADSFPASLKFGSSGSDFIRCLWAYYTAILDVAIVHETSHPRLLIFDEPKQQDVALGSFRSLLKELSGFKKQQVLVFASFENSDASFHEATDEIAFHLNRIGEKLIMPAAEDLV